MRRSFSYFCLVGLLQCLASLSLAYDYNGTPVAWAVGLAETSTTVKTRITEGWRPTSIDAISPGIPSTTFATTYVQNVGSHEEEVTLARNVSATTIGNYVRSGWRVEDLEKVGATSFTVLLTKPPVTKPATGYFANLSTAQVSSLLGTTRRLLELDSVVIDGARKFNGVYVSNTGSGAVAWGWMPSASIQSIFDWANQNNMRIIDLDPRSTTTYAAVFVKRKAGERYYVGLGSWSAISELQESSGTRIQVLNKLEGQNWYAALLVNNVGSQPARIADSLLSTAGRGRIGAYVAELGGPVLVNLRGNRDFYPCSAIKVLIHAAGLAAVSVRSLDTYKINGMLYSEASQRMMINSDNDITYMLNHHFGTDYINQFGMDSLGTTDMTWIADHFGNPPPDSNWNAHATLQDMTNIYANRGVLGPTRVARFHEWMYHETNSSLYDNLSRTLATSLGLSSSQYDLWKSRVRFEFKAGNVFFGSDTSKHTHWVNVGRVTLPVTAGNSYITKTYLFGHFVNDSLDGYPNSVCWAQSAGLVREQLIQSLNAYR